MSISRSALPGGLICRPKTIKTLDDRTVYVFETLNTLLRTRDIFTAGKILAELDYAEKPPKPYTKQELKAMFAAMDDEEKLLYGLFRAIHGSERL